MLLVSLVDAIGARFPLVGVARGSGRTPFPLHEFFRNPLPHYNRCPPMRRPPPKKDDLPLKKDPPIYNKMKPPRKKIQISKTAINICFICKITLENNRIVCSSHLV